MKFDLLVNNKREYPKLMISKKNDMIVLFFGKFEGIELNDRSCSFFTNLNIEAFDPFIDNSEITINIVNAKHLPNTN